MKPCDIDKYYPVVAYRSQGDLAFNVASVLDFYSKVRRPSWLVKRQAPRSIDFRTVYKSILQIIVSRTDFSFCALSPAEGFVFVRFPVHCGPARHSVQWEAVAVGATFVC